MTFAEESLSIQAILQILRCVRLVNVCLRLLIFVKSWNENFFRGKGNSGPANSQSED